MNCPLCDEPVDPAVDQQEINTPRGRMSAHRECLLRAVVGGIGHLLDHAYWCLKMHDPDGGMTLRQSALAVDEWVHTHDYVALS